MGRKHGAERDGWGVPIIKIEIRKPASNIRFCLLALVLLWGCRLAIASPATVRDSKSLTREDYIILTLGCVNIPGNAPPCQNDPRLDWQDWLALVRVELGFGPQHQDEFDNWSQTHVRFVHAPTANPHPVKDAVDAVHPAGGSIYLLGFSAGGAAILNYLKLLREQTTGSIPPILAAIAVDSPVGTLNDPLTLTIGHYIDFPRLDLDSGVGLKDHFGGLGAWCQAHGIRVVTISYENDYFAPKHAVADIPYKLIRTNSAYAGPFDLERNHGYFFSDPNGLHAVWSYLTSEVLSH